MQNFIGVIDSGVGGLTILKKLAAADENQDFLYIADHSHCPYGTKSGEEILNRAEVLIDYLQAQGASSVVIACNTASVFTEKLRERFSLPIYDVIEPTCIAVQNTTKTKRVALLATNATVASGAYQKKLLQSGIVTVDFACSKFVPFVENAATTTLSCWETIDKALKPLPRSDVDTVILGCTHFPLLKSQISAYCKRAVIVECQCDVPLSNIPQRTNRQITYLTTGNADFANAAAKPFGNVFFKHLSL